MSNVPATVNPSLLATGRELLCERPTLTEAEFRNLMLDRLRADDESLQHDKRNMTAHPGNGTADGLFAVFMLPWTFFRWLGWRGRLSRHRAEMDVVVQAMRAERRFAPGPG